MKLDNCTNLKIITEEYAFHTKVKIKAKVVLDNVKLVVLLY